MGRKNADLGPDPAEEFRLMLEKAELLERAVRGEITVRELKLMWPA